METRPGPASASAAATHPGALPNVLVIGAMKAGTSALHRYLDTHPDAAMSSPKELCFFYDDRDAADGPGDRLLPPAGTPDTATDWSPGGNWFRGLAWYRRHFTADAVVRGESSPGYTSPDHPAVAARVRALLPDATLIMLVRDPVERAVSQYRHHRRDGDEQRPPAEALLDPASQYLARSRYVDRLRPFLDRFPREQLVVVVQEELRTRRRQTLQALYAGVGLDPAFWTDELDREWHTGGDSAPPLAPTVAAALGDALADDARQLRELVGRDLPWSV